MQRVSVIGNSGGGKSTIARRLAARLAYPCVEIDTLLWLPDWRPAPVERYDAEHARLIAAERWIIDGLGRLQSIPQRLSRSTDIVLIDLPLWMHFWLAAERQLQWAAGDLKNPPAGIAQMPRTEALSGRSGRSTRPGCRRSADSWPWRKRAGNMCPGSHRSPIWRILACQSLPIQTE
jgi:adenylate kinase family enzyme